MQRRIEGADGCRAVRTAPGFRLPISLVMPVFGLSALVLSGLVLSGLVLFGSVLAGTGALAQMPAPSVSSQATPYDSQLLRLSEILGSVTYLRNLCADRPEPEWRATTEKLLSLEAEREPDRKRRLTAAFNRGYRAFAALHSTCTSQARMAESRYRAEGATLVDEMTARFGN